MNLTIGLILATFVALGVQAAPEGALRPDAALALLKDGHARYLKAARSFPHQDAARRQKTAKDGQAPFATILGCSDSRAPLEHIFDAGLGDLFVVRIAGNVSDTDEIGSMEYGVEHLHTPLLVVLGHSGCGAVTAVVKGDTVEGSIPALVDNIVPAAELAKTRRKGAAQADIVNTAIELNVWQSIADLLKRSPMTVELVKEKKLKLIGAVYHLDSGEVAWLGEHPEQTALLGAGGGEKSHDAGGGAGAKDKSLTEAFVFSGFQGLFLALMYLFVASRSLRVKRMKAGLRMVLCSFVAIGILALSFWRYLGLVQRQAGAVDFMLMLIALGLPLAFVSLFSFAWVRAVSSSFREYVLSLRGGRSADA